MVDWHSNSDPPLVDRNYARLVIEVDEVGIADGKSILLNVVRTSTNCRVVWA